MRCGEATLLCEAGGHGVAVTQRCKKWDCDLCGPINQRKLRRLVVELGPLFFVTLTVLPYWFDSPDERARRLGAAWSRFCRWYRRRTGQKPDFVAVFEATARGEPHLHIALRVDGVSAKALERLLATWMGRLIGAPNVDVRPFVAERHLGYMTKAPVRFDGCHRYRTSRGWRVAQLVADVKCVLQRIASNTLATVERAVIAAGRSITNRRPNSFTTDLPFAPP